MRIGRHRETEDVLLEHAEVLAAEGPRVARALERIALPAFVHDGAEVVLANEAAASWLGYQQASDIVGRGLGTLCFAEDQVALLAAVGATSSGAPWGAHLQRFRFRHGRVALGHVLARRLPERTPPQTAVVVEPVTSTHRSPEHLRLLEAAVDHLRDIVFITEADSIDALGRRVVFVNRAFSRVTGFEPSDVLGKTPNVTVGDATDRAALARIEHRLKRRLPVREELEKFGKDGQGYWVELDIIPVFDDEGRHTHWVSVQRDITERKRLRADLEGADGLARHLAEEVSDPLSKTMECLEVIAQRLLEPVDVGDRAFVDTQLSAVRQDLERCRTSAQRARSILRQLAVIAEGSGERRREIDLGTLLSEVLDDVRRDVEIPGDVMSRLEPVPPIAVAKEQLHEMLYGTIVDAAHALDPRFAADNTLYLRTMRIGDGVVCEVEATGPGAAGPSRSQPKAPGTELARIVASSVARSVGVELAHHPSPGTGTRYRITFPLRGSAQRKHESSERISPRIRSASVLIAEADPHRAMELRKLLAVVDHVFVESGRQAAERRLRAEPNIDVVFCDVETLARDAIELYKSSADVDPALPGKFVFARGAALSRSLETFLEASGRPEVGVPFVADEVRAVLSSVLYSDLCRR